MLARSESQPLTRGLSVDLVGHRFGRLLVQYRYGTDRNGNVLWACWCDCGVTTLSRTSALTHGQRACSRWCGTDHVRPAPRKEDRSPVAIELAADMWNSAIRGY